MHQAPSKFRLLVATAVALASATALAQSPAGASASADTPPCGGKPLITYTLGSQSEINRLYPVIQTASQSAYDRSMAVASSIQFYLQYSLTRDLITDACRLKVTPDGAKGYQVSFYSSNSNAADYGATQNAWLRRAALGLKGVQACQGSKDPVCWEPKEPQNPKRPDQTCLGPWQFYLPLGLPMLSQKMVMLLHYPPYSAMQQSDYLNNATLNRWQRLLTTVGVSPSDWTLYTTTVDIFPIAAPGSGEDGCFPAANAVRYFGAPGSTYIPSMLEALVAQGSNNTPSQSTRPVIIFGAEAIGYWNATYPKTPTAVLQAGSANLSPATPKKLTPFMGANHPIAAVYQSCSSKPGISAMAAQDLATACFAMTMGNAPNADPEEVAGTCQKSYENPAPESAMAVQLCTTAVIDKSSQFAQWGNQQAAAWCAAHNNQPCPLPDYFAKP